MWKISCCLVYLTLLYGTALRELVCRLWVPVAVEDRLRCRSSRHRSRRLIYLQPQLSLGVGRLLDISADKWLILQLRFLTNSTPSLPNSAVILSTRGHNESHTSFVEQTYNLPPTTLKVHRDTKINTRENEISVLHHCSNSEAPRWIFRHIDHINRQPRLYEWVSVFCEARASRIR